MLQGRSPTNSFAATTWFAVLEQARLVGNFERAAEAARRLKEMGIEIRFISKGSSPNAN